MPNKRNTIPASASIGRRTGRQSTLPSTVKARSDNGSAKAQSLNREADHWVIKYDGRTVRIRDCKGLSVVAHLVRHPGRRFRSRDLLGLMTPRPQPLAKRKFDRRGHALGNDYRRRLVNLRDALRRARAFDDSQAAAEIERQMTMLTRELAQAVGLGDAKRGKDPDRVINRAITSAIANISQASRGLARHLRKTITADPVFSYIPE